jgi:group I intron endonuclease
MYVYCITNKVNGKRYIGKTVGTPEYRWRKHVSAAYHDNRGYPIHHAICKYGANAFEIQAIARFDSKEMLSQAEEFLIEFFDTYAPRGYNVMRGGLGGSTGHSEETRKKIGVKSSKANRGTGNGRAILTLPQVSFVRSCHPGFTQSELAELYGVCPATIAHIRSGRNWNE